MSDGLTVQSWSSVSWRCFGLLVPTGPRSEAWECGLAYSKEEEGLEPVVTAVEEQDIPLSRAALLLRSHRQAMLPFARFLS